MNEEKWQKQVRTAVGEDFDETKLKLLMLLIDMKVLDRELELAREHEEFLGRRMGRRNN